MKCDIKFDLEAIVIELIESSHGGMLSTSRTNSLQLNSIG